MKYSIFTLIILMFSLKCLATASMPEWDLVQDENNIQVYTQDTGNTRIIKSKAVTVINFSLFKVRDVLNDIENRHKWVPFLIESKAITEFKKNKRLEYSLFFAPWPASDRDFVYSLELVSANKDEMVYKMHSQLSKKVAEIKGIVRGELYESSYKLTRINKNTTRVELIYHADPKGWLPTWIINIIQRILPYKILRNLEAILESRN